MVFEEFVAFLLGPLEVELELVPVVGGFARRADNFGHECHLTGKDTARI